MVVVTNGLVITVAMGTEVSKVSIGRDTAIGPGVAVGVGVSVAVAVGVDAAVAVAVGVPAAVAVAVGVPAAVAVAVGVGEGVAAGPVMVMRPCGELAGSNEFRSASMKKNWSGATFQTNGLVSPGLLLTLSILRLKSVPDPLSGVKSSEKADMRRVLSVPGPVLRTLEETFQLLPVRVPVPDTCGVAKPTTAESKVKSPWKPT